MAYGWSVAPPSQSAGGWSRYKPPRPKATRPRPVRPPKPPTRPVHRTFTDPFAPLSDAELRARAASEAQGALGPLLAQIQQAIEARSRSGMAAIGGLTNELGGLWRGVAPATQGIYGEAQKSGSQINDALANRLGQFGQGLQGEMAGKAALQGAPAGPAGEISQGAAQTALGAANAGFARGSAGLEMLNTQGAAAGAYGAKLPGIAGLTGIQSGRQLQAQLNQTLADQLSSAQTGAASSQSSIYQHLLDQELQKAIASQSGLINKDKLAAQQYNKRQDLIYKRQKDKRANQIKMQSLGISAARVTEYARHNGISEQQAQRRLIQQGQRNKVLRAQGRTRNRIAQQNANTSAKGKAGKKKVPKGLGG
jgi:hypothetical protein